MPKKKKERCVICDGSRNISYILEDCVRGNGLGICQLHYTELAPLRTHDDMIAYGKQVTDNFIDKYLVLKFLRKIGYFDKNGKLENKSIRGNNE